MTTKFHIQRAGSPISASEFDTAEDAIANFAAPAWVGAKPTEIEMIGNSALGNPQFRASGETYEIVCGYNRKAARATARPSTEARRYPPKAANAVSISRWLTREMDRADSDY